MIYISTGCIPGDSIRDRVELLAQEGFLNIELTGGTKLYDNYLEDLINLKEKYHINYLVHNYFPPPKEPFVLNLGSKDKRIIEQSLSLCKKAIYDASLLGSDYYSFHAGFYFDPKIKELGEILDDRVLASATETVDIFQKNVKTLEDFSRPYGIKLFIENNVVNLGSFKSFNNIPPAMLLSFDEFLKLKSQFSFNLLLDVAHLKVSVNSLGLNFSHELSNLIDCSNYLHLSDNSGLRDENKQITIDSDLFSILRTKNLNNKVITLEVYESIDKIRSTYNLVQSLLK
jgi:sugar phosphate isomerase/epimerase